MPDISGTNVMAPVRPYHTDCTHATALADEIAGGLKYVAAESDLSNITPERRPVGTVVSVGFGKFKQWTGSAWLSILQGFDPPTVMHSTTDVKLRFGETTVGLKAAGGTSAGVMLPAMYTRLMGHGRNHLQDGDDAIAATRPTSNLVPQADEFGKISSGWLPFGTGTLAGTVRVADDGTSPPDAAGVATAVLRADDSRITRIPDILTKLEQLSFPIRYVTALPDSSTASPQTFYWHQAETTLYLLIDGQWTAIAGSRTHGAAGRSAYEIAQDQGYAGSIDEWLAGLGGTNGRDGRDGKSAYELARDDGFGGTVTDWLGSLKGAKGDPGLNGSSVYELAKSDGFAGSLTQWLATLKGAKGDKGESGEQGPSGTSGKSAFELAVAGGYSGTESQWTASLKGAAGKSAFELARAAGYPGTESEWLASLRGPVGMSAYETARSNGFIGTEAEWLAGLRGSRGEPGVNGASAYAVAVEEGFEGGESEWLASLRGEKGEQGEDGRGITILDYYESHARFIAEHPTGFPGDCYGVEGDLYLWAHDQWKNLGRLIGAIAFEFELVMEQLGLEGTTFEDFLTAIVRDAVAEMDLDAMIRAQVDAWLSTHLGTIVAPQVRSWLAQNMTDDLDSLIADAVTARLPAQLASHVSTYHEWLPL